MLRVMAGVSGGGIGHAVNSLSLAVAGRIVEVVSCQQITQACQRGLRFGNGVAVAPGQLAVLLLREPAPSIFIGISRCIDDEA